MSALDLCSMRQESREHTWLPGDLQFKPDLSQARGRGDTRNQSLGPLCLCNGGSGCRAVPFRGAPGPWGGGTLPPTVCRFALPGIDLLCLHSGVLKQHEDKKSLLSPLSLILTIRIIRKKKKKRLL